MMTSRRKFGRIRLSPALLIAGVFIVFVGITAASLAAGSKAQEKLEYVIKSKAQEHASIEKPFVEIPVDTYETILPSLAPDNALSLTESPKITSDGLGTRVLLKNNHLLQPWNDILLGNLESLDLRVKASLMESMGHSEKLSDVRNMSWTLDIVDEDGKLFQRFKGTGISNDRISWNGRSDQGQWLAAGHAYSAVYVFQYADSPHTYLGHPLQVPALMRRDAQGSMVSLDSSILFGQHRDQEELIEPDGRNLMRVAADFIKRNAYGSRIEVRLLSPEKKVARRQAQAAKDYLVSELFLPSDEISISVAPCRPTDAQLEIRVAHQ